MQVCESARINFDSFCRAARKNCKCGSKDCPNWVCDCEEDEDTGEIGPCVCPPCNCDQCYSCKVFFLFFFVMLVINLVIGKTIPNEQNQSRVYLTLFGTLIPKIKKSAYKRPLKKYEV